MVIIIIIISIIILSFITRLNKRILHESA